MKKIIFSGVFANRPHRGGGAWHRLQYILGLKKLGYDVYFIEEIWECYDKDWNPTPFNQSYSLKFFKDVVETFGIIDKCSLIYRNGEKSYGLPYNSVLELSKDADLLINFDRIDSKRRSPLFSTPAKRIYIDTDPGYTQIWHETYKADMNFAGHDIFFTRGENIGNPDCPIPTCGIDWKKTRPPVVLDFLKPSINLRLDKFTTISSLNGYSPLQYKGEWYGLKDEEFMKFITLPKLTDKRIEVALDIHPHDKTLKTFHENGWIIVDPKIYTKNPHMFQEYIQNSDAELSVAKNMYVKSNCGWFSERSTCYLASGKPVLLQDTGFSKFLPVGEGLLAFRTMDELLEGVDEINRNYHFHCKAARKIAEEYFDSDKVLTKLLKEVGL